MFYLLGWRDGIDGTRPHACQTLATWSDQTFWWGGIQKGSCLGSDWRLNYPRRWCAYTSSIIMIFFSSYFLQPTYGHRVGMNETTHSPVMLGTKAGMHVLDKPILEAINKGTTTWALQICSCCCGIRETSFRYYYATLSDAPDADRVEPSPFSLETGKVFQYQCRFGVVLKMSFLDLKKPKQKFWALLNIFWQGSIP